MHHIDSVIQNQDVVMTSSTLYEVIFGAPLNSIVSIQNKKNISSVKQNFLALICEHFLTYQF